MTEEASGDVLYESERSLLVRIRSPRARAVRKEARGRHALQRMRHELSILEHLADAEGVVRALAGPLDALLMEEIAGPSLAQLLKRRRLEGGELIDLAERIARIVGGVHRAGIIHGDIAPSNILLSENGPVLIDFDHAVRAGEERPAFMRTHPLTGNLAYLAPEQSGRTTHTVDHRADLYALGVVLYEAAAGRLPFTAEDPLQLLHDHLACIPTPPASIDPQVPSGLSDIILRLLEKEPDHRYQSAEGLAYDLAALREALARGERKLASLGKRDFPLRLSPPSRLVGRDAEIAVLRESFETALRERRRGVFVSGPAGVGKTALINELRPIVAAEHGWFVAGKFDQYRNDVVSGAVFQALRALGRLLLSESEAKLAARKTTVLEALGSNAGLIASLVPELSALFGEVPETPPADPANAERRLLAALLAFLRSIASLERPIVFVIDDLQWADPTSMRFIEEVLSDEELRNFLLVGAYREAESDGAHSLARFLSRWDQLGIAPPIVRLSNLPAESLSCLLEQILRLPSGQAHALMEAVGAHTHGNPYDTVEFVNELRRDKVLTLSDDGWHWDEPRVRRYIGRGEVVDLLSVRISKLPPATRDLLSVMACVGGTVDLAYLAVASGYDPLALREALPPALEAGLLIVEGEDQNSFALDCLVRFRHDRVQQAAYALIQTRRAELHLEIARRLAPERAFTARAAQQYLAALPVVHKQDERMDAARLFREAAVGACLAADYLGAEALLLGTVKLFDALGIEPDAPDRLALDEEMHAVLYSLGRYDEADAYYANLERRIGDPIALSGAACRQISSIFNRRRLREAILLGIEMLRRLGREPVFGDAPIDVREDLDAFYRWFSTIDLQRELARPEPSDPGIIAALEIMERLQILAIYGDPVLAYWMTFESQRLWETHGACRPQVADITMACVTLIALRGDYRTAYDVMRFAISVGEARHYEPTTSWARGLFSFMAAHWVEPLEECVLHARRAYDGIVRGGDVQQASHTFHATYVALQDSASIDACAAETEAALAFDQRTGSGQTTLTFLPHRQMLRALRGETQAPGSLNDASFNEEQYVTDVGDKIAPVAAFHVDCALMGAIFGDSERLIRHVETARSLLAGGTITIQGMYRPGVVGRLLQTLVLVEHIRRTRGAGVTQTHPYLAQLDGIYAWFSARTLDAPMNFAHLARFVQAERAWAEGDMGAALAAFEAARGELRKRKRPWHHAFITEREGLCCLEMGLPYIGRSLLVEAQRLYEEWGALGKVEYMEAQYPFLASELAASRARRHRSDASAGSLSSRNLDLLALLRASQTLSSETDLNRLRDRIVELLGAMTGATKVSIALRQSETKHFVLLPASRAQAEALTVESAAAAGLLPLSAFRYALRSREPFLVSNALGDDRFSEDPYFRTFEQCSLCVIPILSQGAPLAVLLLENHLSSGFFSEDSLDATRLIVGQLAVSLNNALLYASLEEAYEQEKRVANTFQEAALDPHLPKVPGLALDAVYHSGRTEAKVGGDWYDAFRLPDGRIVFSVGDVSGSGLHAAVTMGSVRQSIRTAALINPDPVSILEAVDRIVRATERDQFVTAFVGVLDPLFFEFTYANAGHPYPLLRMPDGAVQALLQNDVHGDLPLGLRQRDDESTSASISVEPGSLLTLYTDGLTEFQRDPVAGEKKLHTSVRHIVNLRCPASELYRSVLGAQAQHDDVAILTISFERAIADMQDEGFAMQWEFDANDAEVAHAKQKAFVSLLERAGFTPAELMPAELVFGELLGNVVRYASGQVKIIVDLSAEAPVLHVLDRGHGFEHNRRLPKDIMSEHGRGLFLVTAFAEEIGISRRKDGGSHARVVLTGKIRTPLSKQGDISGAASPVRLAVG